MGNRKCIHKGGGRHLLPFKYDILEARLHDAFLFKAMAQQAYDFLRRPKGHVFMEMLLAYQAADMGGEFQLELFLVQLIDRLEDA